MRIDAGGASRRVLLGDAAPAELAPVTGDLHVDEIRGDRRVDLPGRLSLGFRCARRSIGFAPSPPS